MRKNRKYQRIKFEGKRFFVFSLTILLSNQSCQKLVQVTPPSTSINSGNVYANDATAIAAVTNIYVTLSSAGLPGGGITSLNLFPGLSADELSLYGGATNNSVLYYYNNALTPSTLNNPDFWTALYKTVYVANAAMEGLSASTSLTPAVKQQLTGESKFIRAFCYFYLVNLYGEVPLALGTDYTVNATLTRAPQSLVYQQIIRDLKDAQSFLSTNYLNSTLLGLTSERVRPTQWVATALLARAYLYTNKYDSAEDQATFVISNNSLFSLTALKDVFLKNSNEAIWQLQPVNTGWNTEDARTFKLPITGPNASGYPFYVSSQLIASFEDNDLRRTNWIDSVVANGVCYYYPFKYKSAAYGDPVTEYEMVFRLGEQYLIRAEARVQLKENNSIADLNMIRNRAGLNDYSGSLDKTSLLNAIIHERQVELFSEWGHRWLDLKRVGEVDAIMNIVTPKKGGTWNTDWQWYPISRDEIQLNNNLIQNTGY